MYETLSLVNEQAMPICKHAEICGGCLYQGVEYSEQLEIKNAAVLAQLEENEIKADVYRKLRQTSSRYGYRNKMEYSFGDETKGGEMTLGLHKRGSYMSVINTDGCQIVPPSFNRIRDAVLIWALASGHGFHHKRTHSGFLRSLVIRHGERTGELLVNLVTSSEEVLDEQAFVKTVLAAVGDVFDSEKFPVSLADSAMNPSVKDRVVSVLHTINDRRSDVVACDSMKTLYGADHYFDELLGMRFRVGAFSFFQTNTSAADSMLTEALALVKDARAKSLYDVYCGAGTISLALSKQAEHVTGIELVEDAVLSARENAVLNGIENVEFICGDAFEIIQELPPPDMVTLDPPRMGLHPKALKRVMEFDLPSLLYISCNPKTFAQNAAVLKNAGYGISVLGAYDNFPFTKHIELAGLLTK